MFASPVNCPPSSSSSSSASQLFPARSLSRHNDRRIGEQEHHDGERVNYDESDMPTMTALSGRQDLHEWLLRPTVIPSGTRAFHGSYQTAMPHTPCFGPFSTTSGAGVIRSINATCGDRKHRADELNSEEEEKRQLRRERNKIAAARCRNRRRELTEKLQNETDLLEEEKARLQSAISILQKEKDHLEIILATHRGSCKLLDSMTETETKVENTEKPHSCSRAAVQTSKYFSKRLLSTNSLPQIAISSGTINVPETESLNTPPAISTPLSISAGSSTPSGIGNIFLYPSGPEGEAFDGSCAQAHRRRSSSSGEQTSSESRGSPTLLAL